MIVGPITRLWSENALLRLRSAFWTCLAALCLLVLTDWTGDYLAVLIAGREAFRNLLPSSYVGSAHRNVTYTLHPPANVTHG
jgi:hypothetical protein